jgi:peroxiredoxin
VKRLPNQNIKLKEKDHKNSSQDCAIFAEKAVVVYFFPKQSID